MTEQTTHSYFQSENDVNIILRGVRLLLRMARTEPLASLLETTDDVEDQADAFWPGHADPHKARQNMLESHCVHAYTGCLTGHRRGPEGLDTPQRGAYLPRGGSLRCSSLGSSGDRLTD